MSGARGNPAVADDEVDDIPLVSAGGKPVERSNNSDTQGAETFDIVDVPDDFDPRSVVADDGQQARGDDDAQDDRRNETADQRQTREREDKSSRRARQREARDRVNNDNARLRAELSELRERLDTGIEPRLQAYDETQARRNLESIDQRIAASTARANTAKRTMSEAMIAQDAEAFAAALDERDQAFIEGQRLAFQKQQIEQAGGGDQGDRRGNPQTREQPRAPAPPPLPRAAREHLTEFQSENDWIDARKDARGRFVDPDTRILMALDSDVAADGFNPSTQEYWDELRDRRDKYLPHRKTADETPARSVPRMANGGQAAPRATEANRRGPMVGAGNNGAAARPGATQVKLTAGRKQALIQAGVLEPDGRTVTNPTKFRSYLASFDKYDRANGVAQQ